MEPAVTYSQAWRTTTRREAVRLTQSDQRGSGEVEKGLDGLIGAQADGDGARGGLERV